MERRAFLQLLCLGIGAMSAATPIEAFPLIPLPAGESHGGVAPEPSIGIPEDVGSARFEKIYYGHYRRVHRRHYRRVSRRVYRRHHYYY